MFARMWHVFPLLGGYALEVAVGYPDRLYRAIRHPVVWMGALIGWLERRLNGPRATRLHGAAALFILIAAVLAASLIIAQLGAVVELLAIAMLLATRSLHTHVKDVAEAATLDEARAAVAKIVGRDVALLDAHGVARAAIESLAESFCDGVVAPFFWGLLFGLPGVAVYKAVNTADSMIGHKDARYREFGWAAARLDDVANFIPARLAGALIALVGGGWRILRRDHANHASPNAGWPEAAMAGALGLKLAGPVAYDGEVHDKPFIGDGRAEANAQDIKRALALYVKANVMLIISALALAALS